jgi:hypothetical protein
VSQILRHFEQTVIGVYRRRPAPKRDPTQERPVLSGDEDCGPVRMPSGDPTAGKVAEADQARRAIIELRQQGDATADLTEKAGWDIRTVQHPWKDLLDSMDESGG